MQPNTSSLATEATISFKTVFNKTCVRSSDHTYAPSMIPNLSLLQYGIKMELRWSLLDITLQPTYFPHETSPQAKRHKPSLLFTSMTFFHLFDNFHFFDCFQFFNYFHFCDYYNFFDYSCISWKSGQQVAPVALVDKFATRWHLMYKL